MHAKAYRIISTTRLGWGIRTPEATPTLDGVNARGEGAREPESEGARGGPIGDLRGDLRGRESGAHAPRFGRWAGQGLGVRPPMRGETPLSRAEVDHGIDHDIIDPLPTRRIVKPVGAWELANVRLMAKASFFDGLLA